MAGDAQAGLAGGMYCATIFLSVVMHVMRRHSVCKAKHAERLAGHQQPNVIRWRGAGPLQVRVHMSPHACAV